MVFYDLEKTYVHVVLLFRNFCSSKLEPSVFSIFFESTKDSSDLKSNCTI